MWHARTHTNTHTHTQPACLWGERTPSTHTQLACLWERCTPPVSTSSITSACPHPYSHKHSILCTPTHTHTTAYLWEAWIPGRSQPHHPYSHKHSIACTPPPTHECTHTHTHKHTHTHTHTHICTQTPTHMHAHTHAPTQTHTHIHQQTPSHTYTHTNTHTNTLTPTQTPSYTHTNTLTHRNTLTHTCTHTNTLTHTYTITLTHMHPHKHPHTHMHSHKHPHTHPHPPPKNTPTPTHLQPTCLWGGRTPPVAPHRRRQCFRWAKWPPHFRRLHSGWPLQNCLLAGARPGWHHPALRGCWKEPGGCWAWPCPPLWSTWGSWTNADLDAAANELICMKWISLPKKLVLTRLVTLGARDIQLSSSQAVSSKAVRAIQVDLQ